MPPRRTKIAEFASAAVFAIASAALLLTGGGQERAIQKRAAEVLETENSQMQQLGLLAMGSQYLKVKILEGERKGEVFRAENNIRAQMDLDKIFNAGDKIIVSMPSGASPQKDVLTAQDYDRTGYAAWLFGLFAVLLLAFGGWTGAKALLSFVFAFAFIWKVVVPACLSGMNAVAVCFGAVALLSFAIIFLVGGFSRKALAAFCGAISGVGASCAMAVYFTDLFSINGATMPFSLALLNSGHEFLKLPDLFVGGIFLSSSGAVMDLAMDVAAGQEEIFFHRRDITRAQLALSGVKIGRSVVGTMTTTLLLAYSGGFLTLIMAFTAEGVSAIDFVNNPYVASEIVKTIIGSFGLVLVAPLTAAIGGIIIPRKKYENID